MKDGEERRRKRLWKGGRIRRMDTKKGDKRNKERRRGRISISTFQLPYLPTYLPT